jgi:hypothetical protein
MDESIFWRVYSALITFFDNDCGLFQFDSSERSMTHKFAEYLQKEFQNFNVDCEYNRRGAIPKTMPRDLFPNIQANDNDAKTIFPDILIHERGRQGNNLLVIEVKKSNSQNSEDNDITKLKEFTKSEGNYQYSLGLFIIFDIDNKKIKKINAYKNGSMIEIDNKFKEMIEELSCDR